MHHARTCRFQGARCGFPGSGPKFATGDRKKRVAVFEQAERIIMEDAPIVPLYTLADIYGVARSII